MTKHASGGRILELGRNCWCVPEANRAAVLIDAACYFSRLDQVLRLARRSVLIVGWDFDGRIRLQPDRGEDCPSLGEVLRALVESRPELEIRILVWSIATLHGPSKVRPLLLGASWQEHPRIHLRLDSQHPIYGAHHQKIVCIDDRLAFVGGIDLTVERWDTARHAADDPARQRPSGTPYGPVHDLQVMVDGAAAAALADLARQRWQHATDEATSLASGDQDLWPADLEPDFRHLPVAIARTAAPWGDQPALVEGSTLLMDALTAARRSVYIETQYLVDFRFGDLVARRLAEPAGPEVVIITAKAMHGSVERFAMGSNRDRLIRRMKRADHFDRLRVFHPVVPAPDGVRDVLIHAKLILVDDRFVRIGSSNISNRSVALDTECDLAIEAARDAEERGIALLRARLLAEHLGVGAQQVEAAVAANGSLVRAIDSLNRNTRGLRPFDALTNRGPTGPILGTRLVDPRRPFEPLWFLRRRRKRR
jgi:phosphatidylserine/phosphatidylglycerophosphate/cardiolipin synthase-like enzyme